MKQISSQIAPSEDPRSLLRVGAGESRVGMDASGENRSEKSLYCVPRTISLIGQLADKLNDEGWRQVDGLLEAALMKLVLLKVESKTLRAVGKHRKRWRGRRLSQGEAKKQEARQALRIAVRTRQIPKPTKCGMCGRSFQPKNLHGHHEDYDHPYAVKWLCRRCHQAEHSGDVTVTRIVLQP